LSSFPPLDPIEPDYSTLNVEELFVPEPKEIKGLTVTQLLEEAKSPQRIYPLWWNLCYWTLKRFTRNWPVFQFGLVGGINHQGYWDPEIIYELTIELVFEKLLNKGSLSYIVGLVDTKVAAAKPGSPYASPDGHFGLVVNLIKQQITDLLDSLRVDTLTANLMDRITKEILPASGTSLEATNEDLGLPLHELEAEVSKRVLAIEKIIDKYPRYQNLGMEKLSRLYETPDLARMLDEILESVSPLSLKMLEQAFERSVTGLSGSISSLRAANEPDHFMWFSGENELGEPGTSEKPSRGYRDMSATQLAALAVGEVSGLGEDVRSLPLRYSDSDRETIERIVNALSPREHKYLKIKAESDKWNQSQLAQMLGFSGRKYIKEFEASVEQKIRNLMLENEIPKEFYDYFGFGILLFLGVVIDIDTLEALA
jgi:hypothetical protein